MPSSAETSEEKLSAAIKAVNHVLQRICADPEVAFLMGNCTESYELLCQAMATYKGQTVAEIMEVFTPAKPRPVKPGAQEDQSVYMTPLQRYVANTVSVAPLIAAEIIEHASKHGLDLFACGDGADDDLAEYCSELAFDAFVHWADAQRLAA